MDQLPSIITALLSSDNAVRSAAEKALSEDWSSSERAESLLLFLSQQSTTAEDDSLKAFCAVLWRRIAIRSPRDRSVTTRQLNHVTPVIKAQMRSLFLTGFTQVNNNGVRHKLADAIAELAKEQDSWPELVPALVSASQSQNSGVRESCFRILSGAPEIMIMSEAVGDAIQMFGAAFQDQDDDVRVAACQAFVAFFQQLPRETWDSLGGLLPPLLNSLPRFLETGKEAALAAVLESLIELVEVAPRLFQPLFETLVQFGSSVILNKEIDGTARMSCLELLTTFSEVSANMCKQLPLYSTTLVDSCLFMLTEVDDDLAEWQNADDEDDEEEEEYNAARQSLDRVSIRLGGTVVAAPLMGRVVQMCQSRQWQDRQAALMGISSAAEGCRDVLLADLDQLLKMCTPLLKDSNCRVQWAACNALGQLSTDFADTLQRSFGDLVLSSLVSVLGDRVTFRVQSHAAAAMVNFCENSPRHVLAPHLDSLLESLLPLLQSPKRYVQEQALTTIAVVADVAQKQFAHYYNTLMPLLLQVLATDVGSEHRLLKAKSIECATLIALAVGREQCSAHLEQLVTVLASIQQDATTDDDPVRPYLEQGWGRMCRILKSDFAAVLPIVLPPLLEAARANQDLSVIEEEDVEEFGANEDFDIIQLAGKNIAVHTALLDDKASALGLVKLYAEELGPAFSSYVEPIISEILVPALDFYLHDGVRNSAAEALPPLLKLSNSQNLCHVALDRLIDALRSEPVQDLIVTYYECIPQILKLHPQLLNDQQLAKVAKYASQTLAEMYERINSEEEDEEEEDDEAYTNQEVLEEIANGIGSILQYSSNFAQFFSTLIPTIATFINDSNPVVRAPGLLFVAHMIRYTDSVPYREMFVNQVGESLTSADAEVRKNANIVVGNAALYGGEPYKDFCLATLEPMLQAANSSNDVPARECAASAFAKVAHAFANGNSQIIQSFVSLLPICQETDQAVFAYNFLADIAPQADPAKVVDAVIQALLFSSIGGKTAERAVASAKQLLSAMSHQSAMVLLQKYPQESQAVIQKWFS